MKTYYTFKTVKDFERFLHRKNWKSGELDYVTIGKKIFTMHEYDSNGQNMSWANKKHDMLIDCNTSNRYGSSGFTDAKLYRFTKYGALRNDIDYAE